MSIFCFVKLVKLAENAWALQSWFLTKNILNRITYQYSILLKLVGIWQIYVTWRISKPFGHRDLKPLAFFVLIKVDEI